MGGVGEADKSVGPVVRSLIQSPSECHRSTTVDGTAGRRFGYAWLVISRKLSCSVLAGDCSITLSA